MPLKMTPTQSIKPQAAYPGNDSAIRTEFAGQQALYDLQPAMVRRFLELQAQKLADAIRKSQIQASFSLPDKVSVQEIPGEGPVQAAVPPDMREQLVGGVINRLTRADLRAVLRQRLGELEGSTQPAVSASARLLRHALALYMVYDLLPAGRSVTYTAAEGEEIPTLPAESQNLTPESAITQASDAIVEEVAAEEGRRELQVPFVPAARRFYLPQWVAFDDQGELLVHSA